ncbi:Macrophage colony-stimulating factor 1 receptor [Coniothyrium glycines]
MASIVAEPLDPRGGFNWVFLVELLISGILTIFFLFYFNRLFATVVAYGIRAYTWRTFNAYIDITSLQVSLLGGRIFFKDIRYHGHNETILVHGGYITWNYWLRRVRDAGVYTDTATQGDGESERTQDTPSAPTTPSGRRSANDDRAEKGGKQTAKQLPCRISVKVSGIEAFMYNRSPAYDNIVEAVERKAKMAAKPQKSQPSSVVDSEKQHDQNQLKNVHTEDEKDVARADTGRSAAVIPKKAEIPAFLKLLPIHIDISKGAIVVGNEHTATVITAQFDKASGTLDASTCGPLDVYQQLFNFQVTHPVVHMKPNPDYKLSQLDFAAQIKQDVDQPRRESVEEEKFNRVRNSSWLNKFTSLFGIFARSSDSIHTHAKSGHYWNSTTFSPQWHFPGQERWKGLARYLDDTTNDGHGEWDGVEYAKTSLIADCPCVNVSFYWDVAGPVPGGIDYSVQIDPARPHDINGSIPPEYGMDIQIFGGTINYGPWADRHRGVFQNFFFPGSHVDAVPAAPLAPGETRALSVFKLFLSIEEDTVLRIPIREPSKDWKWKGKAHTLAAHVNLADQKNKSKTRSRKRRGKQRDKTSAQNVRPFAWIDVKVTSNSSVNYVMDMYASKRGFQSKVSVDIPSTEISSSVNHGLLWRSGAITLDCDLSAPLGWNTLRKWLFDIKCQDLELFLLRDHLFLLTDLVADWGSGPPPQYFLFVPFLYTLNIDFTDFKLYLNTNDSNIINNPADLEDNNFVILHGQRLHGDVTIPLDKFRPLQNDIKFDVQGEHLSLEISMPLKNTLKTFVKSSTVARLGGLTLTGSHTFQTETSSMNTDRLYMDIQGHKLKLELYGWLIHHFMKIKDNYFGDDMHFKTLEEFQGLPGVTQATEDTTANGQPVKISNDLDVILCISVDQATVLVPSNLYSAEQSIRADLPYASADLRFTNYYMDLMVNFSPISVALGGSVASPDVPNEFTSGQTELFIDSVVIFGHRLFGLPPAEPTYVCNWDFDVGAISGECTSEFVETAAGAVQSFAFTLDDDENSLPLTDIFVIHDATFLRLRTREVNVWLHISQQALLLKTSPVRLDFNDLAGTTFSQKLSANIPDLVISAVDSAAAMHQRIRNGMKQTIDTHAYLQVTLTLNMLTRKLNFSEDRAQQQIHMYLQDQRTNRTPYMIRDDLARSLSRSVIVQANTRAPAMQYPDIPHPVFLFNPGRSEGSSASTQHTSASSSVQGNKLSSASAISTSSASISKSVRSRFNHNTGQHTTMSSRNRTLPGGSPSGFDVNRSEIPRKEVDRARHVPAFSSVALSSSLLVPSFAFDQVELNMSEIPVIPSANASRRPLDSDGAMFNDVSTKNLDENFTHTSFLISVEPGIRVYCTPTLVECVANLIDLVQAKRPEDLLDEFQAKVMTRILNTRNRLEGKGSSLEFSIRIPYTHIRFQHSFEFEPVRESGKDQYDVILSQWIVIARVKQFPGDRAGENSLALHTTLGSLGLSVTERTPHGPEDDVAIQAEISDVLVWMLQNKETSVNVSFRSFESAIASQKIDYLAALIHRTTLLVDRLATLFIEVDRRQNQRLRYLAWYLTAVQEQYPDPDFLTKGSYALRAARDHLRSHDSWKIISRLRYTWQSLPDDEKHAVLEDCSRHDITCPADAEQRISAMWDQWRTWDLAHVKKSLAMRLLFGHAAETLPTPDSAPLRIDLKSALIKLVADPGPRQSEVALHYLVIQVELLPSAAPTGLMLVDTRMPKKVSTVQIGARETVLHIQWEVVELVEALLKMFEKESLRANEKLSSSATQKTSPKPAVSDHDLHVVFATDLAQITLETINLRNINTGRHMRLSFIQADNKASEQGQVLSAHVHVEVATSELFSRSRPLAKTQFEEPSIYFAMIEQDADAALPNEVKVAAASRKIVVKVEEDVLGFIEVIDSILRDEVVYFHRQTDVVRQLAKPSTQEPKLTDKAAQLPNVSLALFMDTYQIELALLQPLGWSITGSSGRIAVIPALSSNVTLRVDYDLDSSCHRLYTHGTKGSEIISSIQLPSLNGRLHVIQTEGAMKIEAAGMIDTIRLQASELQALVSTINNPEMSHMFRSVNDDLEVLKQHFEETFPKTPKAPITKASDSLTEILFSVQMTLSGINIQAIAPGQHPDSPKANLIFRVSTVQLKATNIGPDQNVMLYPEAAIRIHEVTVEMVLIDAESIRRCGNLTFSAMFRATTEDESESPRRVFRVCSTGLNVNLFAETASAIVDVVNHLQDKIKDLDLSKERRYLRRLRNTRSKMIQKRETNIRGDKDTETNSLESGSLFSSTYSLELLDLQISWIIGTSVEGYEGSEKEDLVLSFRRIDLLTQKDDTARLMIEEMRLQMVPESADKKVRSRNSALLPQMVFNVAHASTKDTRKIALNAAGKSLDLQLDSRFVLPANVVERSIALAGKKFRDASINWSSTPTTSGAQRKNPFGKKRLESLTVDTNFAGAVVHIHGGISGSQSAPLRAQQKGRYSQFIGEGSKSSMALRAPGFAVRVQYQDDGRDPSLNAEIRVDGSANTLLPTVVPIIIDISDSIKAVVRDKDEEVSSKPAETENNQDKSPVKLIEDDNIITADPTALLGRTRLNFGLRICRQEFSLSCQPIARVTAIAKVEDIYITVNSVKSQEHGHFFAVSAAFEKLQTTVQHVYSRESTFSLEVESIMLSLMNSKHLSGTSGVSAILKINPTVLQINARQLQDFLLFREIWVPPEIRRASKPSRPGMTSEPQEYLMQRYQQVSAATAFPWNANVAIADVKVDLDLGQAIGKSSLHINNMWASSKKTTTWEQNLCIGVEKIVLQSSGRTNGFIELQGIKVRTSIGWPTEKTDTRQTPLIQASIAFRQLRVKSGFDYQAFVMADIADFEFLMYNVREEGGDLQDRLVAILDGGKVHVFCHASSAAQGLALGQAIERLIQENQQAYEQSLKDIEKFLRRKSAVAPASERDRSASTSQTLTKPDDDAVKEPLSLHTDVVVTLRSIKFGVFPSTFIDSQVLLLEAGDMQARFAVALENSKIHSSLGMTLGQLSVALSSVPTSKKSILVAELTVEDVAESARTARGGTILRVPKVIAQMHTWQVPKSTHIDYLFRSTLEGKVDVGWNYSRISSIRTMWSNHSRTLASRLGKPLPESNIKISASQTLQENTNADAAQRPRAPSIDANNQEKITAVVNVPQSKYEYSALEPPLIETPQLRDMGEATPPLEWIGLHRDRLPNVTHQIVIVSLLEVAREVEEAYERILGSS